MSMKFYRAPPYWDASHQEPCKVCHLYGNMITLHEQSLPGKRLRKKRKGVESIQNSAIVNQKTIRRHIKSATHINKYNLLEGEYKISADKWLMDNYLQEIHNEIVENYKKNQKENYDSSGELDSTELLLYNFPINELLDEESNGESNRESNGELDIQLSEELCEDITEESDEESDEKSDEESKNLVTIKENENNENISLFTRNKDLLPIITALNTKNVLQVTESNMKNMFKLTENKNKWFPFENEIQCRLFMDYFYVFNNLSATDRSRIFFSIKKLFECKNTEFSYSLYSIKKLRNIIPMPKTKNICYIDRLGQNHFFSILNMQDLLSMILLCPKYLNSINRNATYSKTVGDVFTGEKWATCRQMQRHSIFVCNKTL